MSNDILLMSRLIVAFLKRCNGQKPVADTKSKYGIRTLTAVAPKIHRRKHRRLKNKKKKKQPRKPKRKEVQGKFSPLKFQGITVGRRKKRSLWEPQHESAAHIWNHFRDILLREEPQSDQDPDPGILVNFQESDEVDDSFAAPSDRAQSGRFRSHRNRKYIMPSQSHSGRKCDTYCEIGMKTLQTLMKVVRRYFCCSREDVSERCIVDLQGVSPLV